MAFYTEGGSFTVDYCDKPRDSLLFTEWSFVPPIYEDEEITDVFEHWKRTQHPIINTEEKEELSMMSWEDAMGGLLSETKN